MAAPKDPHAVPSFAHFAGETDEQRDEHIVALETELAGARTRGEDEHAKLVEAELRRLRGGPERQTRPRGAGAQKRSS